VQHPLGLAEREIARRAEELVEIRALRHPFDRNVPWRGSPLAG
jgi:hypothetical protein